MKLFVIASIPFFYAATTGAASIDMDDPRRATGRAGNVRIDAQLAGETV